MPAFCDIPFIIRPKTLVKPLVTVAPVLLFELPSRIMCSLASPLGVDDSIVVLEYPTPTNRMIVFPS